MEKTKSPKPLEKVEWELPADLLRHLREYCDTHRLKECDTASRALQRYLTDRLLEEGE